jgi:hypothetical protein
MTDERNQPGKTEGREISLHGFANTSAVRAIAPSDRDAGVYALYTGNTLYLTDAATSAACAICTLPNIQETAGDIGDGRLKGKPHEITLYFHHPYVCAVERFGLNAAMVNIETGSLRELSREDYHCDVSGYSFGFVERGGKVLYICQTQWNRLDIFEAESGKNLTEREVWTRKTGTDENGSAIYESRNYLDYFHSGLHISPSGSRFISNGWVWSPFDQIRVFGTDDFFREFERGSAAADCGSGYNWDRPCAWIDDNCFAAAVDDLVKTGNMDGDEAAGYEYKSLALFRATDTTDESAYGFRWIGPFRACGCEAFVPNEEGEVSGRLYYDESCAYLVAITGDGAFAVTLDGKVVKRAPDVALPATQPNGIPNGYDPHIRWSYDLKRHVFYTWQKDVGIVERGFEGVEN